MPLRLGVGINKTSAAALIASTAHGDGVKTPFVFRRTKRVVARVPIKWCGPVYGLFWGGGMIAVIPCGIWLRRRGNRPPIS